MKGLQMKLVLTEHEIKQVAISFAKKKLALKGVKNLNITATINTYEDDFVVVEIDQEEENDD